MAGSSASGWSPKADSAFPAAPGAGLAGELTAAVVAFNSALVIDACLAAIDKAVATVVVDNASRDDTRARVAAAPGVRLLALPRNEGFGAAANRALAAATTRYGLLLNADVVLAPDAIARLLEAAGRYPEAALLAPATRTPAGRLEFGRATFLRPRSPRRATAPPEPEGDCCAWYVGGAAMLLRLDAFRAVGGFDEAIFLYCEDDDLCARLMAAGHSLVHVADARAGHLAGRSTAGVADLERWKHWHAAWSRCHVERKHRGRLGLARHLAAALPTAAVKAALYRLAGRPDHARHAARAAGMLAFLAGRRAREVGIPAPPGAK
jgi:GT2 family glycosyltransferase